MGVGSSNKLDGEAGIDIVSYATATAVVSAKLQTNINGGFASVDGLIAIEGVIGFGDILKANEEWDDQPSTPPPAQAIAAYAAQPG